MALLVLAYIAYVALGLPDGLPGTLWPWLRGDYGQPAGALGWLLLTTSAGTMLAGLLAGRLMRRLGTGWLLAGSVGLTAAAAAGAAAAPPWPVLVALALLSGLGAGAVDAALNLFVASRFAPRHVTWMHACWGLGATLGPAIATAALAAGGSWRLGYAVVATLLGMLALGLLLTRARWDDADAAQDGPARPALSVLRQPLARRQILAFFLYCGLEAGTGQWLATVMVEGRGADPALAGGATTLFWASLAIGRVGMGFVVDRLGPDRLLRLAVLVMVGAAAGVAVLAAGPDLGAVALLAVALAPIYPTLMARTPARLGPAAAVHAVGFQVAAATLGAGLLPALLGMAPVRAIPVLLLGLALWLAWLVRRIIA